jgi:hypothetical protein
MCNNQPVPRLVILVIIPFQCWMVYMNTLGGNVTDPIEGPSTGGSLNLLDVALLASETRARKDDFQ